MSEYKDQIDINLVSQKLPETYSNFSFLSFGKRGIVLKAKKDNLDVAIKMLRPESMVKNALLMEAKYLLKANELDIGPTLIEFSEDYVVMEFIEGIPIGEWLLVSSKEEILAMLSVLFDDLFKLDAVRLNKDEMRNPYKHIIVTKELMPVLIDFERARFSTKPKNVTQFSQYLLGSNILPYLQEKNILFDTNKFKTSIKEYSTNKFRFDVIGKIT